jgi:gas vesicle protein
VDSKIEHSFNSLQESKTSNEVKELLAQLLNEIKGLTDKVEPENIQTVEEMVDDVQDMIDELNEPHPRRRIILNYLNTLKNKAVIAAVSTDVITTIIANFMTIVPQLPHLL